MRSGGELIRGKEKVNVKNIKNETTERRKMVAGEAELSGGIVLLITVGLGI